VNSDSSRRTVVLLVLGLLRLNVQASQAGFIEAARCHTTNDGLSTRAQCIRLICVNHLQ
jgi:hypothetical protein